MPLEEYKRKRDFKKTPEPPPEKTSARAGFSYLIQKHDATRLHYDLRLELDGVLLSWAVTRGPSLNPADKRLSVHVEDHPLAYGTFEGTIPKGEYGGGTVMLWDRGTWEPEFDPHFGMQKGHLAFTLHGERLKGKWDLIRMHGGRTPSDRNRDNWLLIKKKDEYTEDEAGAEKFLEDADTSVSTGRTMDEIAVDAPPAVKASAAKSSLRSEKSSLASAKPSRVKKNVASATSADAPRALKSDALKSGLLKSDPFKPEKFGKGLAELVRRYPDVELATLVSEPPSGEEWLHEIKFDGYRLLAFLSEGDVRLRTRNGNDWTLKFPSIYASVAKLKAKNAVLDMEAVVLDGRGKTSFQALQQVLGEEGNAQSIQAYVFDLLHLDGKSLATQPLTDRKEALRALLQKSKLGVRSAGSTWSQRKEPARKEDEYLHYSDHVVGNGAEMFSHACELGLEGVVSKLAKSAYQLGRQKAWLKIKCAHEQEFVIIGFTAARTGSRAIGALHLGYYKNGELTYAGKVGTGFTMGAAQELYDRLVKIEVPAAHANRGAPAQNIPRSMLKGARWVKPELLCEISFTEWTDEGHIRHPSYHGLREDKPAKEVGMETPAPSETAAAAAASADGRSRRGALVHSERHRAVSSVEMDARLVRSKSRKASKPKPVGNRGAAAADRPLPVVPASRRQKQAPNADPPAGSPRRVSSATSRSRHAGGSSVGRGFSPDKKPATSSGALAPGAGDSSTPAKVQRVEVLGVNVTHPDRVLFEDVGVTKGHLAQYYAAVAQWVLKDIAGHPLSVIRCPDGIAGQCFFQRSPNTGLGADIKPFRWRHKGKSYDYFYIDDEKGLIELIQMGSVELHPWGARAAKIDYPDRLIFDLDPDPSVPFEAVKLAAEDLRRRLKAKGLESFLKTTGGKGLHVTVPLAEKNNWEEVKGFGAALAGEMVQDVPSAYVATMTKAKRTGKIFVDYFRNDYTATAIADFGVRARAGTPVAVPLEWSELRKLRAANQFSIADVLKRIKTKTPEPARYKLRQRLP